MIGVMETLYSGKVRDLYPVGDDHLLLVATDRISAFDVVMDEPVVDKGRVLTAMSAFWFDQVADPVTGRHGYTKRGEMSSRQPGRHASNFPPDQNETLTGAALMCRYLLGQNDKDNHVMKLAADLLLVCSDRAASAHAASSTTARDAVRAVGLPDQVRTLLRPRLQRRLARKQLGPGSAAADDVAR